MNFLNPTYYFDYEHPNIQSLIAEFQTDDLTAKEKAMSLYLKIRDGWRYYATLGSIQAKHYKASYLVNQPTGNCLEKSILLIACLRALDIPARIHLAKIKNHLAVEHLVETLGTNELAPHGYVSLSLEGKWLKASPAFNIELCQRYKVAPLEFDGENDSLFQQFNEEGDEFMEYLEEYGYFEDFPIKRVMEILRENFAPEVLVG